MPAPRDVHNTRGVRVRQIASLVELAAAWRLVADVLRQDDSHPRNYPFYARHFPSHPQLLLIALAAPRDNASHQPADGRTRAASRMSASSAAGTVVHAGGETLCGALLAHAEPEYVWIGKLAVAAEYRGCGAGSAFLALLERNAAAAGYRRLMLGAARDAEPFYTHRGYHPTVLQHQPDAPPQPVFAKTL